MISFKKFDPRAFLEQEHGASIGGGVIDQPGDTLGTATLATLATLAGPDGENEKCSLKSPPLIEGCNQQRKNGFETEGPAKVAKTAKVNPKHDDPAVGRWGDDEEERAALIEHDGDAPRTWAEALARLDPALPPGDVPSKRWLRFIDDCGNFLDEGWARRAAELGWTPLDLFGCDRSKPFARIGRCGLLWLLEGRRLRVLTSNTAVINTANGRTVTFYRHQHEPGEVVAWELVPWRVTTKCSL